LNPPERHDSAPDVPQSEQNSLRGYYRFIKGGAYLPMIQ
jgi:hypothetical protein